VLTHSYAAANIYQQFRSFGTHSVMGVAYSKFAGVMDARKMNGCKKLKYPVTIQIQEFM